MGRSFGDSLQVEAIFALDILKYRGHMGYYLRFLEAVPLHTVRYPRITHRFAAIHFRQVPLGRILKRLA